MMYRQLRPVCGCGREMYPKKNSFECCFGGGYNGSGDLYECEDCGAQVVVGFGTYYESMRAPEATDLIVRRAERL